MSFTDIKPLSFLPPAWLPYALLMRLDRPIGTWLLLLPGWWALALGHAPLWHFALFAVGAVVMRGAGCVINDLWDRDIDAQVERTRGRPLASGAVSAKQALVFLAALCLVGLIILLQFNRFAVGVGAFSLLLIISYPLMKRVTWWPQAFLGFTFNWGVLLGAAAATGTLPAWVWPLYAAGVLWTLAYDTIYAHADTRDDALIGVKSTARLFGSKSHEWIAGFYIGALILLVLAGMAAGAGFFYYSGLVLVALQTAHLFKNWDMADPASCIAAFRANRYTGMLILAAILTGRLI